MTTNLPSDDQRPQVPRKWCRALQALAAAAIMALGILAVGAAGPATGPAGPAAAQAATVPVIYNNAGGWRYPTVRPKWVLIGQGGSPMAHTWYWNTWNSTTAKSTGTLWVTNCVPTCAQSKYTYHKLYVTLYWVKGHNGTLYFYGMKWYTPGWTRLGLLFSKGWTSTVWLHYRVYPGGSIPAWQ
jgi:hypothetical protein